MDPVLMIVETSPSLVPGFSIAPKLAYALIPLRSRNSLKPSRG
jgi:hypothetical protein